MAYLDDMTKLPGRRALNEKLVGLPKQYALAMVDAELASDASHQDALRLKISILQDFASKTKNFNASGWIANGVRESRALLGQD